MHVHVHVNHLLNQDKVRQESQHEKICGCTCTRITSTVMYNVHVHVHVRTMYMYTCMVCIITLVTEESVLI